MAPRLQVTAAFPLLVLFFSIANVIVWHYVIIITDGKSNDNDMANALIMDESFLSSQKSKDIIIKSYTNATQSNHQHHHEIIIPQDGFSGCLLLKNDNERLAEWLAYHWLTLPLKYLIVAVDPTGTTSPQKILQLWNTTNMGMDIELWNDSTYGHWINEELDEMHKHRDRQKRFLAQCQLYHKKKGRTWLAVIDADEYITYNTINSDDPNVNLSDDLPKKFLKESYRKEMMDIRKEVHRNIHHYQNDQTLFSYINENKKKEPWISESCHLMPRLFFSAVESSNDIITKANVERYGLDPLKFSTLRYFHHAKRGAFHYNHYGKVIVDMSRIKLFEIDRDMYSVHRPNHKSCLPPTKPYSEGILRVHHYLGSWEQYSSRSDVRRSREKFNEFAWVDYGVDYQLQFWLEKFVKKVGMAKAQMLLNSSGKIERESIRLMDREDFVHVQPKIDELSGDKEELTYFYDEDGSLVHTERKDGSSISNSS